MVFYDNALADAEAFIKLIFQDSSRQGTHEDAVLDQDPHNRWGPGAYGPPLSNWVDLNAGSQQIVKAWGLVNHNAYIAGQDTVVLGGNNNGSTSFITVDSLAELDAYDHDPCVMAVLETPATYQWWQFLLTTSLSPTYYGGFYLARESEEFPETPDAPFVEDQFHQIVSAENQGGVERRQVRGEPFYTRTLRWDSTTQAMADLARKLWLRQHGRERYFLYVPHSSPDQPSASMGYYTPEIVRLDRLTIRDLSPGGRYSILMTLVGLLRIDH